MFIVVPQLCWAYWEALGTLGQSKFYITNEGERVFKAIVSFFLGESHLAFLFFYEKFLLDDSELCEEQFMKKQTKMKNGILCILGKKTVAHRNPLKW